jgi:hypothetical protein
LSGRYKLLAPRIVPHLPHLCTHKLASSTVLRIINQRNDPESAQLILDSLFNSTSNVLEDILGDQVHGLNMIQKILASQYIDSTQKQVLAEKVKTVLLTLRVQVRIITIGREGCSSQIDGFRFFIARSCLREAVCRCRPRDAALASGTDKFSAAVTPGTDWTRRTSTTTPRAGFLDVTSSERVWIPGISVIPVTWRSRASGSADL